MKYTRFANIVFLSTLQRLCIHLILR